MGTPGQLVSGIRGHRIKEKWGDADNAQKFLRGDTPQKGVQGVPIIIFVFIFILFHAVTAAAEWTPYPYEGVLRVSIGVRSTAKMIFQLF